MIIRNEFPNKYERTAIEITFKKKKIAPTDASVNSSQVRQIEKQRSKLMRV